MILLFLTKKEIVYILEERNSLHFREWSFNCLHLLWWD